MQTVVFSMTSSITRHLAADILGSVGAPQLENGKRALGVPWVVGLNLWGLYSPQPVSVTASGQSLNADVLVIKNDGLGLGEENAKAQSTNPMHPDLKDEDVQLLQVLKHESGH